jgi:flagellar biosynthesis protein FliP
MGNARRPAGPPLTRIGSLSGWVCLMVLSMLVAVFPAVSAHAASSPITFNGFDMQLLGDNAKPQQVATALRLLALLTVLSLAPAIVIVMTSFTRIVIVLSMLRHATGMQDTPPNAVLISLALILSFFTMTPALEQANQRAFTPYLNGAIAGDVAASEALKPFRDFMIRQTREQDVRLILDIAHAPDPATADDLKTVHLIPAFMLSELKTAFEIGFVIFLPFLLIDLIVSSVLMAMGMLMVPPMMISLPLKVLMFILIDGWNIVVGAILESFH